jgi:hypothetical protein
MAVIDERFEHAFGEMRAAREEMRVGFAGLRGEIAGLRGDVAAIRGDVAEVRGGLSAFQRQVTHILAGFALGLLGVLAALITATL